jgi:hypothetical protein
VGFECSGVRILLIEVQLMIVIFSHDYIKAMTIRLVSPGSSRIFDDMGTKVLGGPRLKSYRHNDGKVVHGVSSCFGVDA